MAEIIDKMYKGICEKLGFIPSEYKFIPSGYEDDTKVSPFSVLETEELMYLIDNGYLGEPVTRADNREETSSDER